MELTVEDQILEIVKNMPFKPEKSMQQIELVARPFSRKLVRLICEYKKYACKIVRVSHNYEQFCIETYGDFKKDLKRIIKLINKQAKKSENNTTKEKEKIVYRIGVNFELYLKDEKPVTCSSNEICPSCSSDNAIENGKY